jgi:two-component system sensor histidine kinase ChvG
VAESETWGLAVTDSPVGGALEALLGRLGAASARERLQVADAAFGSLGERAEVRQALEGRGAFAMRDSPSGQTVLFSHAAPVAGGGVLYVTKASHRGIRQLLLVREQLVKLLVIQSAFALLIALLLTRWLVRPLERLADGARRYPGGALADPPLLSRPDEIGLLARSITSLAQSLEERRKATVDLAADMAHELKNPLATIAAASELIASTRDASPAKRELVSSHITAAVDRLRATTDELLSLVRLEASLPEQPRQPVPYAAFVEELLAEYRRDPRYADFTLRVEVGPEVGEVRLAREGWARLLRNLLDNALVQPMSRREVVVRAERTADGLVTSVRDFGPGISPGNREKIFRRFFTQRPEGAQPGTGLGLSIVQAVAQAHGGRVEVDAGASGGAIFRVIVPG